MRMLIEQFKKSFLVFLLGSSFFILIGSNIWVPMRTVRQGDFAAPPKMLPHFVFGFREVVADFLWIRSIQDFDYCESIEAKNVCKNKSWLYQMLDVATDLSPSFRVVYSAGSLALSVIISDIYGASLLFDKGVAQYPNDWPILYRAAYHALYEEKDLPKAASLLQRAGRYGAPEWVYTLAGRLYSDSGRLDLARAVLLEMKASNVEEGFTKRLEEKIESLGGSL